MNSVSLFYFVFIAIHQAVSPYRMEVEDGNEAQYCKYRKHLTLKPTSTCCANKVITPGINLAEHWNDCVVELQMMQLNSVEDIGWNMYACILKNSSGGNQELSLQEFSDLVTKLYPDDIKSKIDEQVEEQSTSSAQLTDFAKLNDIRVAYYDIETAVCEGSTSTSFGTIEGNCEAWIEEDHRAGLCCRKAYPVDLEFKTTWAMEEKSRKLEHCRNNELHKELVNLGANEVMEGHILDMCDTACLMDGLNMADGIVKNLNYWEFNVTTEINSEKKWLPGIIPVNLIQNAKQYVESVYTIENTTEAIENYLFPDAIGTESHTFRPNHFTAYVQVSKNRSIPSENFKLDFMRRKFHKQIIHIPILCAAYKDIVSLMEDFLFGMCNSEGDDISTSE